MFIHVIFLCVSLGATAPSPCCEVTDSDKRSFENLTPILVDVDGDGTPDSITPHLFSTRGRGKRSATESEPSRIHWIAFDLKTSRNRVVKSFFRYRYGTDQADYWVYALFPCQENKSGKIDLVFYAGDDTSDETVLLHNTGTRFRESWRRTAGSGI